MASGANGPWGLEEYDRGLNHTLNTLVSRTVVHLSVEFLHTNGIKPHVVFNVKVDETIEDPEPTFVGVRLSMEWIQFDELDTGTFQIVPLTYYTSSMSARGAFDFPLLNKTLTVKD